MFSCNLPQTNIEREKSQAKNQYNKIQAEKMRKKKSTDETKLIESCNKFK